MSETTKGLTVRTAVVRKKPFILMLRWQF